MFISIENYYVYQIGISGIYLKLIAHLVSVKLYTTDFEEKRKVLEQEAGTLVFRCL